MASNVPRPGLQPGEMFQQLSHRTTRPDIDSTGSQMHNQRGLLMATAGPPAPSMHGYDRVNDGSMGMLMSQGQGQSHNHNHSNAHLHAHGQPFHQLASDFLASVPAAAFMPKHQGMHYPPVLHNGEPGAGSATGLDQHMHHQHQQHQQHSHTHHPEHQSSVSPLGDGSTAVAAAAAAAAAAAMDTTQLFGQGPAESSGILENTAVVAATAQQQHHQHQQQQQQQHHQHHQQQHQHQHQPEQSEHDHQQHHQQQTLAASASDEPRMIVAKTTSAGPVKGVLLPAPMYHRRPGVPFPQRRFAAMLEDTIDESELGAPILDAVTHRVCGHISQITGYSRVQIVFVVSEADAHSDLSTRFDEQARLAATLWVGKQPRRAPSPYPQGNTNVPESDRMDMGMGDSQSVSPAILACVQDPSMMHSQCSLGMFGSNEPKSSAVMVPVSLPSSRPPGLSLSPGPDFMQQQRVAKAAHLSGLVSTESSAFARRLNMNKKPMQVQFVHYRGGAGQSGDERRDDGTTGTGASNAGGAGDDEDSASTWSGRGRHSDTEDGDISINVLLPDRKCPFSSCEYHSRGFVRKHDLVRHVITHFDGRLYCGFCPDGLAKSFGRPFLRVEPLKRHLAAVHHAAKYRKTQNSTEAYLKLRLKEYGPMEVGHCSICMRQFSSASELYNHIEGCAVRMLLQRAREESSGNGGEGSQAHSHSHGQNQDLDHGQDPSQGPGQDQIWQEPRGIGAFGSQGGHGGQGQGQGQEQGQGHSQGQGASLDTSPVEGDIEWEERRSVTESGISADERPDSRWIQRGIMYEDGG